MTWELFEFDYFTGKYNMDFDLQLVKNCSLNSPILRLYGWRPNCISLGANQSFCDINKFKTEQDNIDIVKRPTGGRAILHAEELTYSVVMPNNNQVSGKKIYENISKAIVYGLKSYHPKLNEVELENVTPNFFKMLQKPSGALCFASTAKSEIKYKSKKLVGSAQRKLGPTILQHGSILIGHKHTNLVNYLNIKKEEQNLLKSEIANKTTEITSIIKDDVDIFRLQKHIIVGFQKIFDADFCAHELELV